MYYRAGLIVVSVLIFCLYGCRSIDISDDNDELMQKLDLALSQIAANRNDIAVLAEQISRFSSNSEISSGIFPLLEDSSDLSSVPVASFDLSGKPFRGNMDADIAIIEFTDYECPFCRQHFNSTYIHIMSQYVDAGEVRYYVVDFPLSDHAYALQAAIAAHCASRQGRYWDYHDNLFDIDQIFYDGIFGVLAEILDLDMPSFILCVDDMGRTKDQIIGLALEAERIGVKGTPTFLIGNLDSNDILVDGVLIEGARPFIDFQKIISVLGI